MITATDHPPLFETVWVHVPGHSSYWREMLRGVVDRLRRTRGIGWSVLDRLPSAAGLRGRRAAMVARVPTQEPAALLRAAGTPVVNVSGALPPDLPHAGSDDLAVGRLAAEALRLLGLRHLAYFGDGSHYSRIRCQSFVADAARHGCEVVSVEQKLRPSTDVRALLARAPRRPLGCFCSNDDTACGLLQRIQEARLRSPQDFCVLGVGNEDTVLLRSPLPISSIELPTYGIGVAAVEMLLAWRAHPDRPPDDRLLPPLRVVHRDTTGTFGIEDRLVRRALDTIDRNSGRQLAVGDIVRTVGRVSRRALEVRFRCATGRSLHVAIRAARVARAKELLAAPALSMKEVAYLSGFTSPQKFSGVFHQIEGCSPREFRRRAGAGPRAPFAHRPAGR